MVRPVQYDRTQVTDLALTQFWSTGYSNSSIDTLLAVTGLNKHSLYRAFDGKQGLFVACLNRYLERHAAPYQQVFDDQTGLAAITAFFNKILKHKHRGAAADWGCLIVNTAVELGAGDTDVHDIVSSYYASLTGKIAHALEQGQLDGTVRAALDTRLTAKCLVAMIKGVSVGRRIAPRVKHDITVDSVLMLIAEPVLPKGKQ